MLTTRQKVLRNFWYATLPIEKMKDGPKPFRLLGEEIVLLLAEGDAPAALEDRCRHRMAKLSKGWMKDGDPAFRRIHQFDEFWNCSALRMMENSFDNAHFSFVHKGTFGDISQPKAEKYELTETPYGFVVETIVPVKNPPQAARVTGTTGAWTTRKMSNHWYMPFCRTMDMEFPSGLRHVIFNCATPIDDGSIRLVQILFRNDREEDCSTGELRVWDRAIIEEDRAILESTDPDAIVDMSRKLEMHMPSDRPGMLMRTRLNALLQAHGEHEVPR